MARRCWKNFRLASCHCVSDWISSPSRCTESSAARVTSVSRASSGCTCWSVISDPGIEQSIDDVGHQVGEYHCHRSHHQPGHEGVNLTSDQRVDEELAHPRPGEDCLGDHSSTQYRSKVEGGDGDDWDQGGSKR